MAAWQEIPAKGLDRLRKGTIHNLGANMAVLRNNTRINLDIVINPGPAPQGGASLGAGFVAERKFSWVSSTADMTLSQVGTANATYNLPNLTGRPSTTQDTLIGYSNYSPNTTGTFTGSLLYGGPAVSGTNVAPVLLPAGSAGQVLKIVSGAPAWVTAPPTSLTVTTWSAAVAGTQPITSGVGYYVPAGISATFNLIATTTNTHVAVYSARTGASWTINLNGQTVQFGNITAATSISSAQAGDGIWMISTGGGVWFVAFAAGNPSFT